MKAAYYLVLKYFQCLLNGLIKLVLFCKVSNVSIQKKKNW